MREPTIGEFPDVSDEARAARRARPMPARADRVEADQAEVAEDPAEGAGSRPRLRRELLLFGLVGGFGLLAMPFLVYLAGAATLGPYEGGLGAFLSTLYGDFVRLAPAAWALLLGPYLLFWAVRLASRPLRRRPAAA